MCPSRSPSDQWRRPPRRGWLAERGPPGAWKVLREPELPFPRDGPAEIQLSDSIASLGRAVAVVTQPAWGVIQDPDTDVVRNEPGGQKPPDQREVTVDQRLSVRGSDHPSRTQMCCTATVATTRVSARSTSSRAESCAAPPGLGAAQPETFWLRVPSQSAVPSSQKMPRPTAFTTVNRAASSGGYCANAACPTWYTVSK